MRLCRYAAWQRRDTSLYAIISMLNEKDRGGWTRWIIALTVQVRVFAKFLQTCEHTS